MKYAIAKRITCPEDKEAMTRMVWACDKNGRRTITTDSITLSYTRQKKLGSTTKNMDDMHQRRRCRAR